MRDDLAETEAAAYDQREALLAEEAEARQRFAEAVELAAKLGGHPVSEAAPLERAILTYAGLSPLPERNDAQAQLNI